LRAAGSASSRSTLGSWASRTTTAAAWPAATPGRTPRRSGRSWPERRARRATSSCSTAARRWSWPAWRPTSPRASPGRPPRSTAAAAARSSRSWPRFAGRGQVVAKPSIDQLLDRYPAEVRALAAEARKFIAGRLPKATESLNASAGVIGFGYGPGYRDTICTLLLSKTGVKLGLAYGASLPDPEGLLEGSGKVHRHVPLKAAADIRKPGVARLLKAAEAAWKERVG